MFSNSISYHTREYRMALNQRHVGQGEIQEPGACQVFNPFVLKSSSQSDQALLIAAWVSGASNEGFVKYTSCLKNLEDTQRGLQGKSDKNQSKRSILILPVNVERHFLFSPSDNKTFRNSPEEVPQSAMLKE